MSSTRILCVPLARTTFDMESAAESLRQSKAMLHRLSPDVICPENHLVDYDSMVAWLREQAPCDAVILQTSTFVDPRFALEFARTLSVPTVVWAVREPSAGGGRLKLNSMTGAIALTNILHQEGIAYRLLNGNPGEPALERSMALWLKAVTTAGKLQRMRLGVVGSIPPGYFFSLEEETMLRRAIGPTIVHTELHKLFRQAEGMDRDAKMAVWKRFQPQMQGLDTLPEARGLNFAGLYAALEHFVTANKLDALCGRCWPDTFEELDIAPCAIYSLLYSLLPVACEADMGGAVTNAMLTWISDGLPAYFADPVELDEANNTVTFWHCGFGAPELANPDTPVAMGLHPNRKVGPTMEFAVKPGRITLSRLGKLNGKYRLLIATGEALPEPRRFQGTSSVVRIDSSAEAFMQGLAMQGWEYHISFVHADVAAELEMLASILGIEAVHLGN